MSSTSYKKSWVLCWSGASLAIEWVDEAISANASDAEVLRPLIECLWWVCAMDESLSEEYPSEWKVHLRPKGSELYDLLLGLRWARNRMTHQICQWGLAVSPFVWADAEILAPAPTVKPEHDRGRTEYKAHFEGNDPRTTLKRVVDGMKQKAFSSLAP